MKNAHEAVAELQKLFGESYKFVNKRKDHRTLKWWGINEGKISKAKKIAKKYGLDCTFTDSKTKIFGPLIAAFTLRVDSDFVAANKFVKGKRSVTKVKEKIMDEEHVWIVEYEYEYEDEGTVLEGIFATEAAAEKRENKLRQEDEDDDTEEATYTITKYKLNR